MGTEWGFPWRDWPYVTDSGLGNTFAMKATR
jgi:hypothetical protein